MSKKVKNNSENNNVSFLEIALGVGVLFVYIYSIRLGFGQGFFKGLFMMLVPVVAQAWLCIERGLCEPVGFSNLYSWATIVVFLLGICVSKAQKIGAVDKLGLGLWFIVFCAMIAWHDQGATKPTDVALAFAQATINADCNLAANYAADDLREYIENIDTKTIEYRILKEISKRARAEMRNKKMVANIVHNNGERLTIQISYNVDEDVWEPFSEEIIENTTRGWRVASGMNADLWKTCPVNK